MHTVLSIYWVSLKVCNNHNLCVLLNAAFEQFYLRIWNPVNHGQIVAFLAIRANYKHGAHLRHLVNWQHYLRQKVLVCQEWTCEDGLTVVDQLWLCLYCCQVNFNWIKLMH